VGTCAGLAVVSGRGKAGREVDGGVYLRDVAIWELSKIDIVAKQADGVTRLILVVSTWEPEALRLTQLAIKLAGLSGYGPQVEPYRIEVVSYDGEPPHSVLALARQAGATVVGRENSAVTGRPGAFDPDDEGDGELDWPAILAANAAQFAAAHGLAGTVDSLRQLDEVLSAAYAQADIDEDGDPVEDGDLAVLAGSYAGEAMLAAFGGRWLQPPDFWIQVGKDGSDQLVGAFGKVRKFLRNGPEDAVHPLARSLGGGPTVEIVL
jgi:hypothetical protein